MGRKLMGRFIKHHELRYVLRQDSGLGVGNVVVLDPGRKLIGRGVEAQISIDDSRVSRAHAVIDNTQGQLYMVDLGSSNGTYVNDNRLSGPIQVKLGDRIRLGSVVFVVELLEHAKSRAPKQKSEHTLCIQIPNDAPLGIVDPSLPDPEIYTASHRTTFKSWLFATLCASVLICAIYLI